MATSAEIVAVGPFRKDLVDHFEYPSDHYVNCRDGQLVLTAIATVDGRSLSEDLADAIGVDADDPSTWRIDPKNIKDWDLTETLSRSSCGDEVDGSHLRRFAAAGFTLFFRLDA